jgi:hypothetical protein
MKDKPNEERGSVKSTTESYLLPFKETVLAEITKDSDFNLCELMHGSSPPVFRTNYNNVVILHLTY